MRLRIKGILTVFLVGGGFLLMPVTKISADTYYFNTSVESGSELQMRKTLEDTTLGQHAVSAIALGTQKVGTWRSGPLGLTEISAGTYSFSVWADKPSLVSAGNIYARVYRQDTGNLIGQTNTATIPTSTTKLNFSLTTGSPTALNPEDGVVIELYVNVLSVSLTPGSFNVYWGTSSYDSSVNTPFGGSLYFNQATSVDLGSITKTTGLQSVSANLGEMTVINGTENFGGWNLTMSATEFSCCGGTHTLDVTNNWVNPNNTTFVTNWGDGTNVNPGLIHNFISDSEQTTVLQAALGYGYGYYTINPTFEVRIPADAYAGEYSGVITVTLL